MAQWESIRKDVQELKYSDHITITLYPSWDYDCWFINFSISVNSDDRCPVNTFYYQKNFEIQADDELPGNWATMRKVAEQITEMYLETMRKAINFETP